MVEGAGVEGRAWGLGVEFGRKIREHEQLYLGSQLLPLESWGALTNI